MKTATAMMNPLNANPAELRSLKVELADLVTLCLTREPSAVAVQPPYTAAPVATSLFDSGEDVPLLCLSNSGDEVLTMARLRELVHAISRHDGAFVLKVALYARRALHLRRIPNALVALCAPEPRCSPFLASYMEHIIETPDDWLAVANFACAGDDDETIALLALHHTGPLAAAHAYSSRDGGQRQAARCMSIPEERRYPPPVGTGGVTAVEMAERTPIGKGLSPMDQPNRTRIPEILRDALAQRFRRFSIFSFAHFRPGATGYSGSRCGGRQEKSKTSAAASHSASKQCEHSPESTGVTSGPAVVEVPGRKASTLVQLIDLLHITEPAYTVCCLRGTPYPQTEEEFRDMRLHLTDPTWKERPFSTHHLPRSRWDHHHPCARRASTSSDSDAQEGNGSGGVGQQLDASPLPFAEFDIRRAGKRMQLPAADSWDSLLATHGYTGRVWNTLLAAKQVAYSTLLLSLPCILTRLCASRTLHRVQRHLTDERRMAERLLLPFDVYLVYLEVARVQHHVKFLSVLWKKAKTTSYSVVQRARRGRGGVDGDAEERGLPSSVAHALHTTVWEVCANFERPSVPRPTLQRHLRQYVEALDSAMLTAAQVHIPPMRGTTVVILCVMADLFVTCDTTRQATGDAVLAPCAPTAMQASALLIALLKIRCEECIVLLYCYDEYVIFDHAPARNRTESAHRPGNDVDDRSSDSSRSDSLGWGEGTCCAEGADSRGVAASDLEEAFHLEMDAARPFPRSTPRRRPQRSTHPTSLLRLVKDISLSCRSLLRRKQREFGAVRTANSLNMFADGNGAQFPYVFLDEVIERNQRIALLMVVDAGGHRTYAHMNPNAPAFGDVPTYLSRMRRTGSPELIYAGVTLRASGPLRTVGGLQRSAAAASLLGAAISHAREGRAPLSATVETEPPPSMRDDVDVKQRFQHRNDLLIEGVSDAVLRLVAERSNGDALRAIERAPENLIVDSTLASADPLAVVKRTRLLKELVSPQESTQGLSRDVDSALEASQRARPHPFACHSRSPSPQHLSGPSGATANGEQTGTSRMVISAPTSAVALPYFDAAGKAVLPGGWGMDGSDDRRSRLSERGLRWLASRNYVAFTAAPELADSGDATGHGGTALPSIRRLLVKPSFTSSGGELILQGASSDNVGRFETASRHDDQALGEELPLTSEPAWLAARTKRSPVVYMPRPFISILSLAPARIGAPASADLASVSRHGTCTLIEPVARTASPYCAPRHHAYHRHRPRQVSWELGAVAATPAMAVARPCTTPYRVCRFFISSTFLDMNNERNALTFDVFPRLRWWAAEAGLKVTLLEVDLRWGIPAVATTRNLSTSVCLNEVSRCSPFFIGIFGARYGSCPPTPLQLVVDEDVDMEDYQWMETLADPHVSVTELEMRHAVYNTKRRQGCGKDTKGDAAATALFFDRNQDHLLASFPPAEVARRAVYEEDSPTSSASIARLKQLIQDSGFALVPYQAAYADPGVAHGRCGAVGEGHEDARPHGDPTKLSITRTSGIKEDELGRWVMHRPHAFDVGGSGRTSSANRSDESEDSLWAAMTASIRTMEEPKRLTSADVLIDMTDFSQSVFGALQTAISRLCGLDADGAAVEREEASKRAEGHGKCSKEMSSGCADLPACKGFAEAGTQRVLPEVGKAQDPSLRIGAGRGDGAPKCSTHLTAGFGACTAAAESQVELHKATTETHDACVLAQHEFMHNLSLLYAAPRGLMERLAIFALSGAVYAASDPAATPGPQMNAAANGDEPQNGFLMDAGRLSRTRNKLGSHQGGVLHRSRAKLSQSETGSGLTQMNRSRGAAPVVSAVGGNGILLVEGLDGDGKSSALAALMEQVLLPMHASSAPEAAPPFLFYSMQAGDDTVHGLLLFLINSFRIAFQLCNEVSVHETDSIEQLLLALDQTYAAVQHQLGGAGRRGRDWKVGRSRGREEGCCDGDGATLEEEDLPAFIVLLDGLDKSTEQMQVVSLLGVIIHPLVTPYIRFLVSTSPDSPLARALSTRTPAPLAVHLPHLSEAERAQLVRLHLASYGKLLEESFSADELKELLRKGEASSPRYLTPAITYLRLFSTFDTLRQDLRALPASRAALDAAFFAQLEKRFDASTCRLVLIILCLRHPVGGVMEFHLYRLVSNVAVASRLVALLRGICLDSHHGRLVIKGASFVDAIAHHFLPYTADYQSAQERILLAELWNLPVNVSLDVAAVKSSLGRVTESIEHSAVDPQAQRIFVPERYVPHELFGILQGSVQAGRLDVTAALVCYLPYLEYLLAHRRFVLQTIGLLSSMVHAEESSMLASPFAGAVRVAEGVFSGSDGMMWRGQGDSGADRQIPYSTPVRPWSRRCPKLQRIGGTLAFLRRHCQVLLRRPSLLRQCVWNTVCPEVYISIYDAASTAHAQWSTQQLARSTSAAAAKQNLPASPEGIEGASSPSMAAGSAVSALPSAVTPTFAEVSPMWVHWIDAPQHSDESRVMLAAASSLPIRCVALRSDGAEVALAGEDGVVRRVPVDEVEYHRQMAAVSEDKASINRIGGGSRSRVTAALRHHSAVTALLYIAPRTAAAVPSSTETDTRAAPRVTDVLVSGCADGSLYVWSLGDNALLRRGFGHRHPISGLVSHPSDPSVLLSGSYDANVMLWDMDSGVSRSALRREMEMVQTLHRADADGGPLKQRRQKEGKLRQRWRESAVTQPQGCALSSSPVAAQPRHGPYLTPFHTERQHRTPVSAVAFHRAGEIFASSSWDGTLVIHDTREWVAVPLRLAGAARRVRPPSRRICIAGQQSIPKPPRRFSAPKSQPLLASFRFDRYKLDSPARALCFPSSLMVTCVVGCLSGAIVVVDHASSAVVARWTSLHSAPITHLAPSAEGGCVASADERGVVRVIRSGYAGTVLATFNGHQGAVSGLCFGPLPYCDIQDFASFEHFRERRLALLSAGDDGTLRMWKVESANKNNAEVNSGALRQRVPASLCTAITAVASSRDGCMFVAGSADGTAIVYRAPEKAADDENHRGGIADIGVERAAVTAIPTMVMIASQRRWWEERAMKSKDPRALVPAFTLQHDAMRITCIRFALRDTRIVVGLVFGLVYVWSSSPGLNHVEGRLLLRLHVPEHGLYPVVSLEGIEGNRDPSMRTAFSAVSAMNNHVHVRRGSRAATEIPLAFSGEPLHQHRYSNLDPSASLSPPHKPDQQSEASTFIIAFCANGDAALIQLLGDAASSVMVAGRNRRWQRQRPRFRHRAFSSGATLSLSEGESSTNRFCSLSSLVSPPGDFVAPATETMREGSDGDGDAHCRRESTAPSRDVASVFPPASSTKMDAPPRSTVRCHLEVETPNAPSLHRAQRCFGGCNTPKGVALNRVIEGDAHCEDHRPSQDRRAQRLRQAIAECREAEISMCQGYQLCVHRHRLSWAVASDAEEVVSVVWLKGEALGFVPPVSATAVASGAGGEATGGAWIKKNEADPAVLATDVDRHQMALIVTQRGLFLLVTNGYYSATSPQLPVRAPPRNVESAARLGCETDTERGEISMQAPLCFERGGISGSDLLSDVAAPSLRRAGAAGQGVVEAILHELLHPEDYLTAASAAIPIGTDSSLRGVSTCAVALLTHRGEVLILRVDLQRNGVDCSAAVRTSTKRRRSAVTAATEMMDTTASAQALSSVLSCTKVWLCQHLSFTGSSIQGGATTAASRNVVAESRATSVQMCAVPPSINASLHTCAPSVSRGFASSEKTVEEGSSSNVMLILGFLDGSTRLSVMPVPVQPGWSYHTSIATRMDLPLRENTGATDATPDVLIGCGYFGSCAITTVSAFFGSPEDLSSGEATESAASPRWVAGDALGKVHQLQLQRDPPGKPAVSPTSFSARRSAPATSLTEKWEEEDKCCGSGGAAAWLAPMPTGEAYANSIDIVPSAACHQEVQAVTQAIDRAANDGRNNPAAAMDTPFRSSWPSWCSYAPADWQVPADVDAALPSLLRRGAMRSLMEESEASMEALHHRNAGSPVVLPSSASAAQRSRLSSGVATDGALRTVP